MFKRKSGRPLDWMIMLKLYFKHTMTCGPSGVILKELKFIFPITGRDIVALPRSHDRILVIKMQSLKRNTEKMLNLS